MHPLILIPTIKDYIWGGTKLREEFGKESKLEKSKKTVDVKAEKVEQTEGDENA